MYAPAYVAYRVIGGDIAIILAVLYGIHLALARSGWPARERASVLLWSGLILVAWFGAALTLSWLEFFRGAEDRIPTIQLGIFVPIAAGSIALWRSRTLRRILDAVPQSWIVGVQVYRVLGLTFLTLLAAGQLPAVFAVPAGVGDVLTGILALIIALRYVPGSERSNRLVRSWNIFGLLDLAVALATGFMTSPSAFQLLSLDAPNELISAFPLVMIPVFAVPLAILLHMASLMKLRRTKVQESVSSLSTPALAF
jgi:hypothetical protein